MKQLKINSRAFALALLIFGSCISEKDEDPNLISKISNFEVVGQTLSFKDFESYENSVLNKKQFETTNFPSLRSIFEAKVESPGARVLSDESIQSMKEFEGSLILDILDTEGMVIIDQKLFFLDFVNRVVAVTPDFDLRPELKNRDFENERIYLFSFKDDVIGLLEEGSKGTILSFDEYSKENLRLNAFYVGSNCDWDECRYVNDTPGDQGIDYRVETKHVYQSSGIYFKLFSQAKHMKRNLYPLYSGQSTYIEMTYDFWLKSKKSGYGINGVDFEINTRSKFDDDFEIQYYGSSRGLEKYRLDTRFLIEVGGEHGNALAGFSFWDFDLYRISKGL